MIGLGAGGLMAVLFFQIFSFGAGEFSVPASGNSVEYRAQGRRDPFVQPPAGRLRNISTKVEIENLKLTGVIRNSQKAVALFTSRTGPRFGYLLKGGRLFGENHQAIPEIVGEIHGPNEVVLRQRNREMEYRLRD